MKTPHPIPYQGSKRRLAPLILDYFPDDVESLFEPFAGSAAISLAVANRNMAKKFVINDLNDALIRLWNTIINDPVSIAQKYQIIWNAQLGDERNYYDKIRDEFNASGREDYFLYLLVRCVKASVRYNANKEFNQSPDNRRKGTRPSVMRAQILAASKILRGKSVLTAQDYRESVYQAESSDLVYMDPPYQGVSQQRDSRYLEGLSVTDFIKTLEALNEKKISYIVSYDGRTGNKVIGKKLPDFLELKHIEVNAGRSTQATLLGRDDVTYESIYLSPALKERLVVQRKMDDTNNVFRQMEIAL
ncbi:MAG: DNA adenine methylase [Roseiflexaceae bacterium]